MPGWNYTVRLYRPRKEILDGTWKFPRRSRNECFTLCLTKTENIVMKLPPDIQFHEDIRLLVYRPRGSLNRGVG